MVKPIYSPADAGTMEFHSDGQVVAVHNHPQIVAAHNELVKLVLVLEREVAALERKLEILSGALDGGCYENDN